MSKLTNSVKLLWIFLLFALVGCSSIKNTEISDSPQPLNVLVSPAVTESWLNILTQCIEDSNIQASLVTDQHLTPSASGEFDLFLWWGDPSSYPAIENADLTPLTLGNLELALIVNNQNQLSSLEKTEVEAIFTRKINKWNTFSASGSSSPIQPWIYPQGNPIQDVFQRSLFAKGFPAGTSRIAPSSSAVIQAVQEDPAAIGFIIRDKNIEGIRFVDIQPEIPDLNQPLLLLLPAETNPELTSILHCLLDKN